MVVTSSPTVRRIPLLRRPGYPGRWSAKKHREQRWVRMSADSVLSSPYTWLRVTDRLLCREVEAEQRWSRRHLRTPVGGEQRC